MNSGIHHLAGLSHAAFALRLTDAGAGIAPSVHLLEEMSYAQEQVRKSPKLELTDAPFFVGDSSHWI